MLLIRWYGVMYAVAFWLAWAMLPYLGRKRALLLTRDQWTSIIAWSALGVLVGGRLGYVFLYDPGYFIAHPFEIVKIWHGGMSSHGGFIGAAAGVWFAARYFSPLDKGEREGVSLLAIAEVISIPAALGLALGRIGNITNGEFGLYPWYEATWDLVIAGICYLLLRRRERGTTSIFAIFLILYGIGRFLLEYVRPQEWSYIYGLTRGQAYTIPILLAGVILWRYAHQHPN